MDRLLAADFRRDGAMPDQSDLGNPWNQETEPVDQMVALKEMEVLLTFATNELRNECHLLENELVLLKKEHDKLSKMTESLEAREAVRTESALYGEVEGPTAANEPIELRPSRPTDRSVGFLKEQQPQVRSLPGVQSRRGGISY